MQIPILIEPMERKGYRARGGEPLALTAEGDTREEALANLTKKLHARLRRGGVVVPLVLPEQPHPLAEFVGMFRDDPFIEGWKKSMRAHRKSRDKDSSRP